MCVYVCVCVCEYFRLADYDLNRGDKIYYNREVGIAKHIQ